MNFLQEIWVGYRPYAVKIVTDFLVVATLWIVLFLFKIFTSYFEVSGWAGTFIKHLHSVGIVALVLLFAIFSIMDVVETRGRSKR